MMIQDPRKAKEVDALFEQAKLPAVERPAESSRSSSRGITVAGQEQQQDHVTTHTITYWRNGVTVNDGPLKSFGDPNNATYFETIEDPLFLRELEQKLGHVSIVQHVVDYVVTYEDIDIWWDLENKPIPTDLEAEKVYLLICRRLRQSGFLGRVTINAVVGYTDSIIKIGLDKRIIIHHAIPSPRPLDIETANNQAADDYIVNQIDIWLENVGNPRTVLLMAGDEGYLDSILKIKEAGHRLLLCKNIHEDSFEITAEAQLVWEWREFFYLPPELLNNSTRRKAAYFKKVRNEKKRRKEKKRNEKREKWSKGKQKEEVDNNMD